MCMQPQKASHLTPFSTDPLLWILTQKDLRSRLDFCSSGAEEGSHPENILWLNSKDICKEVEVGSKVYMDGRLISLQVEEKGAARGGEWWLLG